MASTINASTSPAAIVQTADGTGILSLQTAGTTAVTIDASQRAAFVAGTAALPAITTTGDTDTGIWFPAANTVAASTSGTERMRIDSGGNVGIGTTTPSSKLNVVSTTGDAVITVTNASSGFQLQSNVNDGYLNMTGSGSTVFRTGSGYTESMRINSSGSLLVNTTSATGSSKFVVAADTTTVNPMTVSNTRSTAATDYSILFYRNANLVGSVQTTLAGVTSYVTSSDYRLKQNILPMTGALTKVMQLKPVTYKWKLDNSDGQGFIAHELQEVVPEAVCGEKDAVEIYTDEEGIEQTRIKPQGVDTSFLVATLTAAIQEQQALITSLTARITALEGA